MITFAEARRKFNYDPETGSLTWRVTDSHNAKLGAEVGCEILSSNGINRYRIACIGTKNYRVHRLVWLWMTGSFPEKSVDHVNGDGLDNRWANLRVATSAQQMFNRGKHKGTEPKGVTCKKGRYYATITKNKKQLHLGVFDTPEEAQCAYNAAAERMFGDFWRAA